VREIPAQPSATVAFRGDDPHSFAQHRVGQQLGLYLLEVQAELLANFLHVDHLLPRLPIGEQGHLLASKQFPQKIECRFAQPFHGSSFALACDGAAVADCHQRTLA
jgi:hypothetical protein